MNPKFLIFVFKNCLREHLLEHFHHAQWKIRLISFMFTGLSALSSWKSLRCTSIIIVIIWYSLQLQHKKIGCRRGGPAPYCYSWQVICYLCRVLCIVMSFWAFNEIALLHVWHPAGIWVKSAHLASTFPHNRTNTYTKCIYFIFHNIDDVT